MQTLTEATHVILIVDKNDVFRVITLPESGVEIENKWISYVFHNKQAYWLSVVFIDNPPHKLLIWLNNINIKG